MKVSIIGTGRVGATLAYTLLLKEVADELVLVNRRPEVAEGHARDLQHALLFVDHRVRVGWGGVAETAGSDVLAICASTPGSRRSRPATTTSRSAWRAARRSAAMC